MVKDRKGIFALGVSLIAMAVAAPVSAADAPVSADGAATTATPAPATQAGDEVIVTGIRASIQASLDQKRKSDMVSEVLTAQDIGKFPDKNVADSLGRLTGVNVVTGSAAAGGFGENQNISIRGTDPSLNLTLLDGHSVATGDWFVLDQQNGGRSFDFSLLPSEIVGSLEVYKSSEADLQEGGIGGTVNLHSRKPLDLPKGTISLTGQMVYNDLASKWTPQASGLVSWKNDEGTFGILAAGFFQKRDFRRDGQEFLGYADIANFAGTGQTVTAPNMIGATYFRQQRTRKGGLIALQFKNDRLELNLNGLYTRLDADNVNTNSMAWISRDIANNSTPGPNYALANYTVSNGILTSATFNPTTTSGATVQGRVQDDIFRKAYSSTLVANADATFHASDAVTLTGEVGYTKGEGATTDTFAWETYWNTGVSYTITGKTADVSFPGLPTDPTSQAYLNNYYSWSWGGKIKSPDTELYGRADLEWEAPDNGFIKSIKVGGRFAHHKRSVNYTAYAWPGNGLYSGTNQIGLGTVYDGDLIPGNFGKGLYDFPQYSLADEDKVKQELDSVAGGRQFAFYPPLSFSVKEDTEAAYAMAKLGDDTGDWRGNIGVRAIHTKLDTVQYSPNAPNLTIVNAFGSFGEVDDNNSYWDILPSANLTYNIQPDLLVRGGIAKTMTRPGYAQLAGAFSLSDLALTGTAGGNPHLKPTRAWNYNLAAEWYYGKQALLSVGVFYLDISSYITAQTTSQFYVTLQHPQGANFLVTAPVNGKGGTNKGFEINWQQPLWLGFGVIANYTYADAKASGGGTIDGNSKNTYNGTIYFENDLLSARMAYSFRSKFRSGIDRGTPMWQDDFGQLDGSLLVHVTKQIAITVDAQNLLNHKLYYFVGDPSVPRAYYNNGRTYWVGAKLNF
ncbi:MAG TPA: TonB-dependent receptor [Sphingomonas sp.]|uniref:TonB-dependent receptor n=1 Tax=Sphingomonas sp. TaxID=28214 RepID=UPI002CCDB976|nr:TonB-dependent receptor [Sphingomonas sp.]HMI19261.1 TonB-dependent receptor [Sphingomonas sp.]